MLVVLFCVTRRNTHTRPSVFAREGFVGIFGSRSRWAESVSSPCHPRTDIFPLFVRSQCLSNVCPHCHFLLNLCITITGDYSQKGNCGGGGGADAFLCGFFTIAWCFALRATERRIKIPRKSQEMIRMLKMKLTFYVGYYAMRMYRW